MDARTYTSIDPAPLARTVVLWVWLDLAAHVIAIVSSLLHAVALQAVDPDTPVSFWESSPETEAADIMLVGLGPAFVTALVAGFLVLKWIYRVSRNAHSLASGLSVRPGWAVGWFFIPLANLLMPFRGVRQAWQASVDPAGWSTVPVPSLLRLWWALWLAYSVLDNASFRLDLRADTISGLIASDYLTAAASLVRLPLDLVLVRLVRRLTELQTSALNQHTFA